MVKHILSTSVGDFLSLFLCSCRGKGKGSENLAKKARIDEKHINLSRL